MKRAYGAILLLLACIPVTPQESQSPSVFRVDAKYDSFTDTTTVQCGDLVKWGEAPAGLSVQANLSFRGKEQDRTPEMNTPVSFWFSLSSNQGGATRNAKPAFRDAKTLYLVADSTRLEIPVKDYRNAFYELVRSYSESASAEMSREDLRKLLDAKALEGKWGGVEFKFSNAALVTLKAFISRNVFASESN
jgi:hypothetical protein